MPRRDVVSDVRLALADHPEGEELASLLCAAYERGANAEGKVEELEREIWALAYIVAEVMDGARPNDVVDDLPHDVRRRVIAVRHASGPLSFIKPSDQFGMLPKAPPRSSVMRKRVRVYEPDAARPDEHWPARHVIEGTVTSVVDEPDTV